MKRVFGLLILLLLIFLISHNYAQQEDKKNESLWEGKLDAGAIELRIVVRLYQNEDGSIYGFMDSPDQNVKDIKIGEIVITTDSIAFKVPSIMGSYSGMKVADGDSITGTWTQAGRDFKLGLKKVEKITELKRPQTPQPPFPYQVEYATIPNKDAGIELSGTITSPMENGKYPAVVMVTGSGPQDRDETIFSHKPFWVIADYLTRHGIVVLRYDDRGFGKSTGNFASATSLDFTSDALSAVEFLKTRNDVDPKKIGIIGHSEGGLIAPMAANNSSDVAFIVLLAGPGLQGSELLKKQAALIMKSNGRTDEEIVKALKKVNETYNIILNEPDSLTAYKMLEDSFQKDLSEMSDEEKNKPENSRSSFEISVKTLLSPWFRFFLKYDPKPTLENIRIPVLALNGEKDLQVPPKEDLDAIKEALTAAGNKNFKIVEFPGLNHLFQHIKNGTIQEYGQLEETFSPDVLKVMGDWINEVTKSM